MNTHYAQVQAELINTGDRIEYAEGIATITDKKKVRIGAVVPPVATYVVLGLQFDNGQLGEAMYRTTDMVTLYHVAVV